MLDRVDVFLAKSLESLAGAESELANGRYNNTANRAYYAMFQAAIAALREAGIRPRGGREWSHNFVAAQFDGVLINRRKQYATDLRNVVMHIHLVRLDADYAEDSVTRPDASRAVRRAQALIRAIQAGGRGTR